MNESTLTQYTYSMKIKGGLFLCFISLIFVYISSEVLPANWLELFKSPHMASKYKIHIILTVSCLYVTVTSYAIFLISIYKLAIIFIKGKNQISLTSDGIEIIEQGIHQKKIGINYDSICHLNLKIRKSNKILSVKTDKKTFSFTDQNFDSESDFGEFCCSISERSKNNDSEKQFEKRLILYGYRKEFKIYSSPVLSEAKIIKDIIESQGISCDMRADNSSNRHLWDKQPSITDYSLWISDKTKCDEINYLIEEYENSVSHANMVTDGKSWICTSCGEESECQFTSCWSCGKIR